MIKTILTMYIIHIVGIVLCVGKEFYIIQILELFYVEIIIFSGYFRLFYTHMPCKFYIIILPTK